jgi:hypothetical protein
VASTRKLGDKNFCVLREWERVGVGRDCECVLNRSPRIVNAC